MICRICKIKKQEKEFRERFDGKYTYRLKQCRACESIENREWCKRNPEKVSAQKKRQRAKDPIKAKLRDRLRYRAHPARRAWVIADAKRRNSRPEEKKARLERLRRWRADNPEKYHAETAVGNALRDGKLFKGPCANCGTEAMVVGHHHDYSKPLDVTWLCRPCHGIEHSEINMLSLLTGIS